MNIKVFVGEKGFPVNLELGIDITGKTLSGTIEDPAGATAQTIGDGNFTKTNETTGTVSFYVNDIFSTVGQYRIQVQASSGGTVVLKSEIGTFDCRKAIV